MANADLATLVRQPGLAVRMTDHHILLTNSPTETTAAGLGLPTPPGSCTDAAPLCDVKEQRKMEMTLADLTLPAACNRQVQP